MDIFGCLVERTGGHVHVAFPSAKRVLSSAVLGGGLVRADRFVNLRVNGCCCRPDEGLHTPESVIEAHCRAMGWDGRAVGMMTAASMKSLRVVVLDEAGVSMAALVTSGLSNALCAGDSAGCRSVPGRPEHAGTINMAILTPLNLSPAAMVEAVAVAVEAKAAVLRDAGVMSRVSMEPATGTGTDSIAVASLGEGTEIKYCGKHVIAGELIGKCVRQALGRSIQWEFDRS